MGISLGRCVVVDSSHGSGSDSVDLHVEVSSVEVTLVTDSADSPLDCRWMPGSDTSNLSVTSSGLSWELGDTESLDDSSGSVTSSNTDGVDHLVLREDLSDGDLLLDLGSSGGLDVSDNTNDLDGRSLDDGDWLDDILLDEDDLTTGLSFS